MEKLLNLHKNNHEMKKIFNKSLKVDRYQHSQTSQRDIRECEMPRHDEVLFFSKPLMRVQKKSIQQQGEGRAKSHLEEVKKKFINLLMRDGEKSKAHKLFNESLNLLEKKSRTSTPPSTSTFGGDGKQTVYKNQSQTSQTSQTSLPSQTSLTSQTSLRDVRDVRDVWDGRENTENLLRTHIMTPPKVVLEDDLTSENSKEHSMYIPNIPKITNTLNIPNIPSGCQGCHGRNVTNQKIVGQECKCNNKAELFQFYTLYNTAEKNGIFEKNEKLLESTLLPTQTNLGLVTKDKSSQIGHKDVSAEENNESTHKNKGYHTERMVEEKYYNDFLKKNILYQAIENVKPPLELRRVRKGGTTYQVPAIVSQKRQERLAIKWIIESAYKRKSKKGNTFSESLVTDILEAFNKTGRVRQKRDEILKIAEYNRAYTRYRWW